MDALDSLRDCLTALTRKEHRVGAKLFRDVVETMDLAAYFHGRTTESRSALGKWYDDEIIPHRVYRDYVKNTQNPDIARRLAKHYSSLSRFTHRTYRAILEGYSRGREDRLVHDRTGELYGNDEGSANFLVLPQTIASYFALLGNMALDYSSELSALDLVPQEDIQAAFIMSLEHKTLPRRFTPRRWLAERLEGSASKLQDDQ